MTATLIILACALVALMFAWHAVNRYRQTDGKGLLTAFENDVTSAVAHVGVILGSADAALQQFVSTYGSILLDPTTQQTTTAAVHEWLPNANVGIGFALFSLVIRIVQAASIVPLPPKGSSS